MAATAARSEAARFNHKAVHVLGRHGWKVDGIADLLGISERSVWRHLQEPCDELEQEREEVRKRERIETHMRTKRGKAPFLVEDFIKAHGLLNDAEAAWLGDDWKNVTTKEKVRLYLVDGVASQSWMARRLGLSRQAVSKHVKELRHGIVHY